MTKILILYISQLLLSFITNILNSFVKEKNIICEKPLVIKSDELNKLNKLKERYKFNLLTCFYRRYLSRFLYIKKFLIKK